MKCSNKLKLCAPKPARTQSPKPLAASRRVDKRNMKDLFQINKTYCTALATTDINNFISTKLSQEFGLFTKTQFTGKLTSEGFNIVVFKKNFFQTRVIAKTFPDNSGSTITIKFKPTINPLFLLVPIWVFFLSFFFVPSFTINGEEANFLSKSLFILFGLSIFTFLIFIAAKHSIQSTREQIEEDLKLKNCVRRPDS
jgi:hypothetical protein